MSTLEYDSPLANFSSLAPDQDLFISINYGWDINLPDIGWQWVNPRDVGVCTSPISQAAADLCARNNQLNNTINGNEFPNQPWLTPTGPAVMGAFNQQQSCTYTCPDGLPFTWTVAQGTVFELNIQLANAFAFALACQNANAHFMCMGSITPQVCVNAQYNSTLTISKGLAVKTPLSFNITSGALPPGIFTQQSADSLSFILSGTPTSPGAFQFTVQVTDANGNFMNKPFTINVLGISNISSVPPATENTPYSFQLTGIGGTGPFMFGLVSGSLPGISISSSGLMSGTPNYVTANKTPYPFSVQVTDTATGLSCTMSGNLKVNLRPGPDWTQLNWTTYQLNSNPPAGAIVTGQGIQNVTFGQLVKSAPDLVQPSISPVAASGVFYKGPGVMSRIILTVGVPGSCGVLDPQTDFVSVVRQDGVQIGGGPGMVCFPAGTYSIDFAVAATPPGGSVFTIDDASLGNKWAILTNANATMSFTWAIVNV